MATRSILFCPPPLDISRAVEPRAGDSGFSLVEVLVALTLLVLALTALADMSAAAVRTAIAARNTTRAAVLAQQKIEVLRALAWDMDPRGAAVSDTTTDTSVDIENPDSGTGLSASPSTSLQENTPGYVDYVDRFGVPLGTGRVPPAGAVHLRRWSIEPLAFDADTLVIRVWVAAAGEEAESASRTAARVRDGALVATVRTRRWP
jgi:prepilin-type N-terminal cleavage/methylation domain-containing protein